MQRLILSDKEPEQLCCQGTVPLASSFSPRFLICLSLVPLSHVSFGFISLALWLPLSIALSLSPSPTLSLSLSLFLSVCLSLPLALSLSLSLEYTHRHIYLPKFTYRARSRTRCVRVYECGIWMGSDLHDDEALLPSMNGQTCMYMYDALSP